MDEARIDSPAAGRAAAGRSAVQRAVGRLGRILGVRLSVSRSMVAGLAIGIAAIALKAVANEVLGLETDYVVLMAGAVLAATIGGLAGGLTATAVTVALNGVLFLENQVGIDAIDRYHLLEQGLFVVVAVATVALLGSRRGARDRLSDALDEVTALARDITFRDARLDLILSASGTGFWEWDVTTGELTWSEAIFRQHGLEPAEAAPPFPVYLETIHPDDRAAFQAATAAAISDDQEFDIEFRIVWPDGSIHWTRGSGRVIRDADGRPIRMLGTGQDITERQRIEAERDALQADERQAAEFREAFVDVISHELRTPITTILGLSQILTKPDRVDEPIGRAAMLEDVRAESERLHRLVEDLLVLSRVERGRLKVDPEPLQVSRLLRGIVAEESGELPSVHLRLEADDDLPVVSGESTYVQQILRNLLENAAKYSPAGTDVVVTARREGDDVAIRVQDAGPGVAVESRDRLFELFYREPASVRSVAGSGIGLFVCASLVEAMGGRIWVGDAPAGGAEFGFTLRGIAGDAADLEAPGTVTGDAVDMP